MNTNDIDILQAGHIRVRACAADRYAGLRGHEYIAARNREHAASFSHPPSSADYAQTDQAIANIIAAENRLS